MSRIFIKISLGWFVAYKHLGNLWSFSNLKLKIREEIVISSEDCKYTFNNVDEEGALY